MQDRVRASLGNRGPLLAILAAALVHGLLYVYLVPPWQHYDEPTHFEYAWLVANRHGWPSAGDYDQSMRRQVAASMLENGFFHDLSIRPDLNATSEPIWIGISETHHRPLYYLLASIPLRVMRSSDIVSQLYAARLVSLLLLLAAVGATRLVMALVAPPSHPLTWLVPTTMALFPGFIDLMTSVSNDVGAVAVFTLFLWACVRLVRLGFSIRALALTLALCGLCLLTKNTLLVALPTMALAVALCFRGRRLLWVGIAATALLGVLLLLRWGDAANWYRDTPQSASTRAEIAAPLGAHALRVDVIPGPSPSGVFQLIPPADVKPLAGSVATVGAWVWASEPVTATIFRVYDYARLSAWQRVMLDSTPRFHVLTFTVPENISHPRLILQPILPDPRPMTIYYDGLVMAEGARPSSEPPRFAPGGSLDAGEWGGAEFNNLLRNGSAESAWPYLAPGLDPLLDRAFGLHMPSAVVLDALLDWPATDWYFRSAAENMLRTFWGKFGWGHVPLLGQRPYAVLAVVAALGLFGAIAAGLRRWRRIVSGEAIFLGLVVAAVWAQAVSRGLSSLLETMFIPVARYASPAIAPTLLILAAGLWTMLKAGFRVLRLRPGWSELAIVGGLVAFDVYALVSLVTFYAGRGG